MGRLSMSKPRLGRASSGTVQVAPKSADPFYQSSEWRTFVRAIKTERGAWCCICGSGHRVVGDHIVEIKDGGAPLDPSNIQLLCHTHHARKTADARARRALGAAQTGGG